MIDNSSVQGARDEAEAWKRGFAAVVPLVREEWPSLERARVEETAGDLDALVALVAEHSGRTKAMARRQLLELARVAELASEDRGKQPLDRGANGVSKKTESEARPKVDVQVDEVIAAVRRLEAFAADEAKRMSGTMLPAAEAKVRQNLWVSLLLSLGLGMILGLWLNGGRRGR
jgi:ElaB/YqjD/DUF883 family membrane-anchored ribosome-binding protein